MPNVYNVSEITNILSGIIQDQSLQDVKVQGEVLVGGPPSVFFLSHAGKKISCFMPRGKVPQFKPLLAAGNTVTVEGNIQIFPAFSEYQILVKDVQLPGINGAFTVSKITETLSGIIEDAHELAEIHVQGEILAFAPQPEATFWALKDAGNGMPNVVQNQQIRCVLFDSGLIQDRTLLDDGNQVRCQGKIQIWGAGSQYEINVTRIESSEELCQCSGCAQCGSSPQCNRPREIANFESCATCLPHPPDELYKLCPECYAISPDHETKVADAVYAYFDELQVNGFSPYIHIRNARSECKECQIQFGARNGIADVVLADGNGSFAAIAECKGAGYVGHGIEQLKSYLSATDTRFGVFANRADPNQWKFYENRRANCIPEIDRSEFEAGVVERITTRERLKDEVGHLNGEITRLENQRSELDIAVNQITQTEHNLTERTSDLTQQVEALENYKPELHEEIRRKLDILLEEKIQRLEKPLADLKIEWQKRGIVNWFKNLFSKENE